jgi:L-iditol 2-dehydrogenase
MKAAIFYGKNDIRVENAEARKPSENEVMIKIHACGVCGTDLHIYAGAEGAAECTPPTILGHEFSGVISETGRAVKELKAGDRVCIDPNDMCGRCYYCKTGKAHFCENMIGIGTTTDGGFAEYCTVNQKQVYKIGDQLPFDEGAMAEPIACCLHGIDLAGIKAGYTVMVIGGGTIGLIMLQLAKLSGAAVLILVEPVKEKRALALKLGADITIDPFKENIEETLLKYSVKNVDTTIECVGLKNTMADAIKYTGKGGTALLFGLTDPASQILVAPFDLFKREVTIKASFINPYTQQSAVSLLQSHKINVKDLITDRLPLDDIGEVFSNNAYRSRGKIIIKP